MSRGRPNNNPRGPNRGGFRGRPRGRGQGRGRGRGRGESIDEYGDFSIYDYMNDTPRAAPMNTLNSPRGRSRGRGSGTSTPRGGYRPSRGYDSPRGRGRGSPYITIPYDEPDYGRGRGGPGPSYYSRGRGARNLASKLRAGDPLSKVLYEDRPLLKPIVFVRSVHTARLFEKEEEEELLQPLAEEVANDERSHVPTADQVARVFSGTVEEEESGQESNADGEEQLEEIDFSEIGRLQAEVDATVTLPEAENQEDVAVVEETFTGFYVDTKPSKVLLTDRPALPVETALGDLEEEVIVYVAPHPRAGPVTPPPREPPEVTMPYTSILSRIHTVTSSMVESTGLRKPESGEAAYAQSNADAITQVPAPGAIANEKISNIELADTTREKNIALGETEQPMAAPSFEEVSFSFLSETTQRKLARKVHPVRTPKALLKKAQTRRKSLRRFGTFGVSLEEAHLHEGEEDPRASERRIGDSDLEWGDGSEVGDAVEELSTGIGAMEIDGELDVQAMARFVKSMSAAGSRHVTMDDITDGEVMKAEDEDEDEDERGSESGDTIGDSEDPKMEAVVRAEEELLISEDVGGKEVAEDGSGESESEDEVSSDEEDTPRRGFQARLEKMRRNASGKKKAIEVDSSSDGDSDGEMALDKSWADKDEDSINEIQVLVDGNADILTQKDRKAHNHLFTAIRDGEFDLDDYEQMMSPAKRKKKFKDTGLPDDLQEQWEKDRATKAENKRKRQLAKLELSADPLSKKKGGKKGMKAMLAAARPEDDGPIELPNRITNLSTLEAQIRRFLDNIGGPKSMTLPPCDKATRKKIHLLADAFNLKSASKSLGQARYTTLTKTTLSGINIREGKVRRILKEDNEYWGGPVKGRVQATSLAKHREGEEVGKAAPKIGESNLGFKLLAAMGWAEGERIGLSGGIDAPLVAIMKKTKLGLGATAS